MKTRKATRPKLVENDTSTTGPSGLQIYLWPRATLTFDLLTPMLHFMPLFRGPLVPIIIKIGLFVFKISCSQIW